MVTVFLEDTQLRAELLAVSMFRNAVHNLSHVGSCFGEHGVDVVEAEHHRENDQHLHIDKKTHDLHRANSRLCQNFPNKWLTHDDYPYRRVGNLRLGVRVPVLHTLIQLPQ